MINFKLFLKKINKLLISINELIESFFNNIHNIIKRKKKDKLNLRNIDRRINIFLLTIVLSIISYFLIPTFYDKDRIKSHLEEKIYDKYNLNIKFEDELGYGLFPKPHFFSKKTKILYNKKDILFSDNSKIYISIKNYFSSDLKVKEVFFKNNEFNIDLDSFNFFKMLFNSNNKKHEIYFKDSKMFFKDKSNEVVFISKIEKLNFIKENETSDQLVKLIFKIFNLPFSVNIKNDQINDKIISKLNSKKIRLRVENEFYNDSNDIEGLLKGIIVNKEKSFNYKINENFLIFNSLDKKIKGQIDFKPFYLSTNFIFNQLNLKEIFSDESVFTDLIKSEILFNENLNANLNIYSKKIQGIDYLKNFNLKIFLEEGFIKVKDSSVSWNNAVLVNLNNIQLLSEDNELKFVGEIYFDFKDLTKFYSYYQVSRNFRKNIKRIKLDFVYNLTQEKMNFDNLKIDNKSNTKIDNYINDFIFQNQGYFNKVTFRNFVKKFFNVYDG